MNDLIVYWVSRQLMRVVGVAFIVALVVGVALGAWLR